MKILIQCEYKLDESEIEEMLLLGLTKKEEIIKFVKNNLDVSVFDKDLSDIAVLNIYYTKAEDWLFE